MSSNLMRLAVVYVGPEDPMEDLPPGNEERLCVHHDNGSIHTGVNGQWTLVFPGYYIRDTLVELQAITSAHEGCLGYAKDTHRLYFWDSALWRQVRY